MIQCASHKRLDHFGCISLEDNHLVTLDIALVACDMRELCILLLCIFLGYNRTIMLDGGWGICGPIRRSMSYYYGKECARYMVLQRSIWLLCRLLRFLGYLCALCFSYIYFVWGVFLLCV